MLAAIILVFSVVGIFQFAVSYWRAVLIATAAQPVSDEVRFAANIATEEIAARDFEALASVHTLTPEGGRGLGFVGTYYHFLKGLQLCAGVCPQALVNWAEREMTACAQFVGVRIDQSLHASLSAANS